MRATLGLRRAGRLSALLLAGLLPWSAAAAAGYDILLDKSGSMAGYANAGSTWPRLIGELQTGTENRYSFGDDVQTLPRGASLLGVTLDDDLTKLADALEYWLDRPGSARNLLIITDNVVDSGNTDALQAQQRFYEQLIGSESRVSHIGLVVLRLPFDGKIYPLRGGGREHYAGDRALILYIFSREDPAGFDVLMTRVERVLSGLGLVFEPIRIKPFDSSSLRTPSPGEGFNIGTPEHLRGKLMLQDGVIWMRNLEVGDELTFPVVIEIGSESSFVLRDVRAESFIDLDDPGDLLRDGDFRTRVDPPRADIAPGASPQRFTLWVEGSRFMLRDDQHPLERAMMALRGPETLRGRLGIRFVANMRNIDLSQALLDDWSHDRLTDLGNPDALNVHDRVFEMRPLVMGLLPTNVEREEQLLDERLEIRIALHYPLGPLIALGIAALILLLLAAALLLWLTRRREFVLMDEYGVERRFVPRLLASRRFQSSAGIGRPAPLTLRYLFAGFLVGTGRGYRVEGARFVSGRDDTIRVVASDEDNYADVKVWNLRAVRRDDSGGGPEPGIWDDGWGT